MASASLGARAGLALAAAGLLLAACGDDVTLGSPALQTAAAQDASSTPQATPTSAARPDPALGGNVTAISPTNGAQVTQAQTRSPDPGRPGGICFQANFEGTPQYAQWFRMGLDQQEVTTELTWFVATREAPKDGTACYMPPTGLAVGRHEVAVVVADPTDPSARPRQTVGWSFDVVP
jgi:hypothetical protein